MLENEVEVVQEPEVSAEPEIDLSPVPEKVREHVDKEKFVKDEDYKRAITHGWKPKDVFVSEGGDEADWTGYKVFNRRYDDLQFRKEQERTIKEIKHSQDALLKTIEQEKQAAYERGIREREEALKVAIADGDAAKAVELQKEILESRTQVKKPESIPEPLPVVDFRRKNPVFNPGSAEFSPEVNAEFEAICMHEAKRYFDAYGRQLSDYEIKVIVDGAYDMVKDKVKKPSQPQKAPSVNKASSSGKAETDPMKRMSSMQKDMYNRILDVNGKDAAERYLKNLQDRA